MTLALTLAPNPLHPRNNTTLAPEFTNADADALVQQVGHLHPHPSPSPSPRPSPILTFISALSLPNPTAPVHQIHNLLDNNTMYAAFVSGWHTPGARPALPSMPYSPNTLPPTKAEATPSSFHCAWWWAVDSVRVSPAMRALPRPPCAFSGYHM